MWHMDLTTLVALWGAVLSTALAAIEIYRRRPRLEPNWISQGGFHPETVLHLYNISARPITITYLEVHTFINGNRTCRYPSGPELLKRRIEPYGCTEFVFSEQDYIDFSKRGVLLHVYIVGKKRPKKIPIS